MQFNQPRFKYVFLIIDVFVITISFVLSYVKVFSGELGEALFNVRHYFNHFLFYTVALFTCIFCFWSNNLYKRNVLGTTYRQIVLIIKSLTYACIVILLFVMFYKINYFVQFGKFLLIYFFVYGVLLSAFVRGVIGKQLFLLLLKQDVYKSRILIVGGDEAAQYVAGRLQGSPCCGFELAGFLDDYKQSGAEIYNGFVNLGKLEDLDRAVAENLVDEILIAIDNAPYDRLIRIVEKCLQTGKVVRVYSNLLNVIAEKIKVEFYADIPVIMLSQLSLEGVSWKAKRAFDIVVSMIALILLAPLFLIIAVGIKLSSPGPVIYKQTRIGKGGRPFHFYKFRSMHVNSENSRHKEFVQNMIREGEACSKKDIRVFKITDDPRIFKFGKFIRKTSFDEFPQFFNVLKGDMSLIGPRPCLPYEWDCYSEWHKKRLITYPGCSGLWQAVGRSSVTFEEMVILDLYYISNMTPWLDARIILQTFPVIFLARGAH